MIVPAAILASLPALISAQTTVNVNLGKTYQTMDGFGFSEAFGFVGGLFQLPSAQQTAGFDYLFSKTKGAGLNIVRNRIGSDSGNTIEPNSPGSPSATPKYVPLPNNDEQQLTFSQIANKNYGVTTFYADAWSAPGYMKTTGNEAGGGYLCGVTGHTCSSGDWRTAYANYLVQYLKDYQAAGIDVTYVGFLNEPEFAASYSAMLSDGTMAASFIQVLAPILSASGLKTKIACCDTEGWNYLTGTVYPQLVSAGAINNLGILTSHSYVSSPTSPINTNLHVWQTEYADLDGTGTTAWYSNGGSGEGLTWANKVFSAVVNARLSAYLYWIGIQSGNSNSGLMFIQNSQAIPTGRLWAFGMFSRYIQPGAIMLDGCGGGTSGTVLYSSWKNPDGSLAVVVINNGGSSASISIQFNGFTPSSATAALSDNNTNGIGSITTSISGGKVTGTATARSMVTFVIHGTIGTPSSGGGCSVGTTSSVGTIGTTTPHSTTTTSAPSSGCAAQYAQCGGIGFSGPTCCVSPYTCTVGNPYYSQCI